MKRLLGPLLLLTLTCTALAQIMPNASPAGEPPWNLRNGRATLSGHLNSQQMLRLAFSLMPPHMAEEEQFLQDLTTPGSPHFHHFLTAEQWNARFAPTALRVGRGHRLRPRDSA